MIIYAIYIINSDGITILSDHFQSTEDIPDDHLLGGLISALQAFAKEITANQQEMKSIEVEGFSYHIRNFGLYRIVMVTDVPKIPDDIIQTLGLRFMKEYGERLLDDFISSKTFLPFKKVIHEIIKDVLSSDISKSIKPSKMLSTGEIFDLPQEMHAVALAMLAIEEGTISEIAEECAQTIDKVSPKLIYLRDLGYIGIRKDKEIEKYFCLAVQA